MKFSHKYKCTQRHRLGVVAGLFGLLSFLGGCLGSSSSDDAAAAATATATALDPTGTWDGGCVQAGSQNYMSFSIIFSENNSYTVLNSLAADAECASPYYITTETGTYTIGDAAAGLTDTYNLNVTTKGFTLTPKNTMARDLILPAICPNYTYTLDTATSVLGAGDSCQYSKVDGEVAYTLIKVDASASPKKLYLGTASDSGEDDGSTEAKRSTELNTEFPFTQQ